MRTGTISLTGRLAIFVEFVRSPHEGIFEGGREVESDSAARLLAAGLYKAFNGFRFYTALVDFVDANGIPFRPDEEIRGEEGPTILVGRRVSRAYLVAMRDSCGADTSDGKAVDSWIRSFDRDPTSTQTVVLRNGHICELGPSEIVVDEAGNPTTDIHDVPDSTATA